MTAEGRTSDPSLPVLRRMLLPAIVDKMLLTIYLPVLSSQMFV